MIGNLVTARQAQKLTKRQGIRTAPRDAPLAVDKLVQLAAPYAVKEIDWLDRHIKVNVTRDQGEISPGVGPAGDGERGQRATVTPPFRLRPGYGFAVIGKGRKPASLKQDCETKFPFLGRLLIWGWTSFAEAGGGSRGRAFGNLRPQFASLALADIKFTLAVREDDPM